MQVQHLLPQVVQPGVNGGIGPGESTCALVSGDPAHAGPSGGPPLPHSPQLMLVIAQAHGQQGTAPELQQPSV